MWEVRNVRPQQVGECSTVANNGGEEICSARKKVQEERIEEKICSALDIVREVECSSIDVRGGEVCAAKIGGGEVVCSVSASSGPGHVEEDAKNRLKTTIGSILAISGIIKSTKKRRVEKKIRKTVQAKSGKQDII